MCVVFIALQPKATYTFRKLLLFSFLLFKVETIHILTPGTVMHDTEVCAVNILVPYAVTYTIWARIQFFVHTAKDSSQSEDTKDSDLPGLIVDVYLHLRLVSLPLVSATSM